MTCVKYRSIRRADHLPETAGLRPGQDGKAAGYALNLPEIAGALPGEKSLSASAVRVSQRPPPPPPPRKGKLGLGFSRIAPGLPRSGSAGFMRAA